MFTQVKRLFSVWVRMRRYLGHQMEPETRPVIAGITERHLFGQYTTNVSKSEK